MMQGDKRAAAAAAGPSYKNRNFEQRLFLIDSRLLLSTLMQ
jgi:hypothetical protein